METYRQPGDSRSAGLDLVVLTFFISYVLGLPFNGLISSFVIPSTLAGSYLPRVVTVTGPAVAALIVASAGGGSSSVRALVESLRLRAHHLPWIVVCAVVGFTCDTIAFLLAGVSADTLFALVAASVPLLLGHVAVQVVLIGVGVDRRHLGAAWHLPVFFSGAAVAASFVFLLASLSTILALLWRHTVGNTGVVAIAHGLVNAPFFFFEQLIRPMAGGDAMTIDAFAWFAGCHAVVALVLVVTLGRMAGRLALR